VSRLKGITKRYKKTIKSAIIHSILNEYNNDLVLWSEKQDNGKSIYFVMDNGATYCPKCTQNALKHEIGIRPLSYDYNVDIARFDCSDCHEFIDPIDLDTLDGDTIKDGKSFRRFIFDLGFVKVKGKLDTWRLDPKVFHYNELELNIHVKGVFWVCDGDRKVYLANYLTDGRMEIQSRIERLIEENPFQKRLLE